MFICSGDSQGRLLIPGSAQPVNVEELESWVDLGMGFLQVNPVLVKVKVKQL